MSPPPVRGKRGRAWNATAVEVASFVDRYGRFPRERSTQPDERRLGKWLKRQRTAERGHDGTESMSLERLAYLDEIIPGWADGQDDLWRRYANDLVAFCRRSGGRWPSEYSTDPVEVRLNKWLGTQRRAARGGHRHESFTASRRNHLDLVLPGWLDYLDVQEAAWHVQAERLGRFVAQHGRAPKHGAHERDEHLLACWLGRRRAAARGGVGAVALTPQRRAVLDALVPGWLTPDREQHWARRVEELRAFMREHGRRPSARARSATERSLGLWLKAQWAAARAGSGSTAFTPARRAILDEVVPGWLPELGREQLWAQRAEALGNFVRTFDRWPSESAASAPEQSLGWWLTSQRAAARGGAGATVFTPARRAVLDEVAPGWLPVR